MQDGQAIEAGRFEFGANWARFLAHLDEDRIQHATASLQQHLGLAHLRGKTFLDVGSGSGLFSLAAHGLGATVHSFDYDPQSVACTQSLRERFGSSGTPWRIEQGSVLDPHYLGGLGTFDVVYSWGVLHHTGQMWAAIENVTRLVKPGGQLFISIYNDQGRHSRRWTRIKRRYNSLPRPFRPLILYPLFGVMWGRAFVGDIVLRRGFNSSWRNYPKGRGRGMNPWTDFIDWVGGYPFEVAKPEEVFQFVTARGFRLRGLVTCGGGLGCNEFVFDREG